MRMPHVSKKKLGEQTLALLEKQTLSLISDSGAKERLALLGELLTRTERLMLAKRLGILFFLEKGLSPYKISEILGISPSTAERFERGVERHLYNNSMSWLRSKRKVGVLMKLLQTLASLAFESRGRSFRKYIENL